MTDANTNTPDAGTGEGSTETVETLTAEVAKWKALSRKNEDQAKANADAAKRLADLEESGKSEAQKAADRVTKAEAEVAKVPSRIAEGLRDALVALGTVSEDDKVLLTASDPETLIAQVQRLTARQGDAKKGGNRAPVAGYTGNGGSGSDDDMRTVVRNLFNRNDND